MDHIGSLKEITEAFPDVQVVMHILEAPYVAGGVSYSTVIHPVEGLHSHASISLEHRFPNGSAL